MNPATPRLKVLTLVFTDLADSTALQARRGDKIVRDLMLRHGGHATRLADEFPEPPEQSWIGELHGNDCIKCHRAQYIPDFFYFPLDVLKIPTPYDGIHYADDPDLAEDRKGVRTWCDAQDIVYFAGDKKDSAEDE